MVIKHLVIAGGGPSGLFTYGAAKFLEKDKFWSINEIETIYGTSIGAFIGAVIALKHEWDVLDDYIIKRPWEKLVDISPEDLFKAWEKKGILGDEFIREALKPLLEAQGLNIGITLNEFYEFNKISLHMISVNINDATLKPVNISYKTFPDLPLVKAISMSCAIPFIFKPIIMDEGCYVDGGLLCNFPLDLCLHDTGCNENEILAFKNIWSIHQKNISILESTNIMSYWIHILKILVKEISSDEKQKVVTNTVNCIIEDINGYEDWINVLGSKGSREKFIKKGEMAGFMFKHYKSN
jgi:predicted acylesterase/phospholipase RssA